MAAPKHPIAHHWIKQTLVPFLLYAFSSTLPYPADISVQIQRAVDFCLSKPDHPSDGDDLVFERIFIAIMHKHRNPAPELEMLVDNLEPLAKYLIRRAQLKGPYGLLGRSDIGSGAWIEYQRQQPCKLAVEPKDATDDLRLPAQPSATSRKLPPNEHDIDPRLVHAQPGQFAVTDVPARLTVEGDSYYRRQNIEHEHYRLRRQQQRMYSSTAPADTDPPTYMLPRQFQVSTPNPHESPYVQRQQNIQQHPVPNTTYMQQSRHQQAALLSHMIPSPYSYPHVQIGQPSLLSIDSYPQSQLSQPHVNEQHPRFQFKPTQQPSPHSRSIPTWTAYQQPPAHQPTQQSLPQIRPPPVSPPGPTLPNPIPSSDFAHLRGPAWTTAAQQRAREIAAKISAGERDALAQGIIQRQQSLARAPQNQAAAATTATAAVFSLAEQGRDHGGSTMADPWGDRGVGDGHAPAARAHHAHDIAAPGGADRQGLPTLEQVRSRYRASPQQVYGPLSSSVPSSVGGGLGELGATTQDGGGDAVQQLWRAADGSDEGAVLAATCTELATPLLGLEGVGFAEGGRKGGGVDSDGM